MLNSDQTKLDNNQKSFILLKLCYYNLADPIKASYYGNQALEFARLNGFKKNEATALSYLGQTEKYLGNNLKAIDYYIKASNIFLELELYKDEAHNLAEIANIFSCNNDYKNSIYYYNQAIASFLTFHDTLYVSIIQNNLGDFFRTRGELDSALHYLNLSFHNLQSIEGQNNTQIFNSSKATLYGNLGMVYLLKRELGIAKKYLLEAEEYFEQNYESYRKSVYQCELGKVYILEGDIRRGEKLIYNSLQIAKEDHLKEQIRDFSLELSSFYELQNKPLKALFYYKQYKAYDDSLKNLENVRKLEQQQSLFQLTKKEEEIAVLNKINKLQRILSFVLFGSVLVVIVFIFILIRSNRRVKERNHQISLQKQLVEEREKEKALLLRELNHRVKNNLQMVASLLSLHSRQLKGHPAADALMAGKYRVEALTLIHQKLYKDNVDTKIDLKDYIEELSQNLVMNFNQDFNLELHLVPFIMKIDKAIPLGLILNELVTNSLKYGKVENRPPILRISILQNDEEVILIIEDNGNGLPKDFDFRESKSFGLKLVHSLIQQLGGKIEWNSDYGTRWTITLNTLKIS